MRSLYTPALLVLLAVAPVMAQTAPEWQILRPTNTGIPGNYVHDLAFGPDGRAYVAADDPIWDEGGVGVFLPGDPSGEAWTVFNEENSPLPSYYVYDTEVGADGTVWMGTPGGLVRRAPDGAWTVFNRQNSPIPASNVPDVALDGAGGVWVATATDSPNAGGLAHFDGASGWQVYTAQNSDLPNNAVVTLAVEPGGAVWAGMDGLLFGSTTEYAGIARFDGTTWTRHAEVYGPDGPTFIAVGDDGRVWAGTNGNGVFVRQGGAWRTYNRATNPEFGTDFFQAIAVEPGGAAAWLGTPALGLLRFDGATTTQIVEVPHDQIYTVVLRPDGVVWTGGIGGVTRLTPDGAGGYAQRTYTVQNTGLPERWIHGIGFEPAPPGQAGAGWFAARGAGASRFDGRVWQGFGPYNRGFEPWPFPTDAAADVAFDADGDAWVAAYGGGVARWDGTAWAEVYGQSALGDPGAENVVVATDGAVWVGFYNAGLARIASGVVTRFTETNSPLTTDFVNDVAAAPDGSVWIAAGLGAFRYGPDGTWTVYTAATSPGFPDQTPVWSVGVAPDGTAWVGTGVGVLRLVGGSWQRFTTADGLPANPVRAITFAPDGTPWVAAIDFGTSPYPGGVARFTGTGWAAFTPANSPLPHRQVEALGFDGLGNLWIGTASEGVAVYRAGGIATAADEPTAGTGSAALALSAPAPNPARSVSRITLTLGAPASVRVEAFDLLGRRVLAVHDGPLAAGPHSFSLDASGLAPGVYVVRAVGEATSASRRLVVVR